MEQENADWIDKFISVTKKYNNTVHSSNKLTPVPASVKSEGNVLKKKSDERKQIDTNK